MAFGTVLSEGHFVAVIKFQSLFFWNGLWDLAFAKARPVRD